jgi:hypothetical protein
MASISNQPDTIEDAGVHLFLPGQAGQRVRDGLDLPTFQATVHDGDVNPCLGLTQPKFFDNEDVALASVLVGKALQES